MDIITIISIGLSILGLFWTWKSIFKSRIELLAESSTIIANLENISEKLVVTYESREVNNDLISVSGYLLNSGNTDIKQSDIDKELILLLPEGSQWHAFNIRKKSEGFDVDCTLTANKVLLNVGLWKRQEGLHFDALMSLKGGGLLDSKSKVFDNIKLIARIHNLDGVTKQNVPLTYVGKIKERLKKILINLFLLSYILYGIFLYLCSSNGSYKYNFYDEFGDKVSLSYSKNNNEVLWIKHNVNDFVERESGFYKVRPVVEKQEKNVDKYLGLSTTLMFFGLFIIFNFRIWKNKRILKRIRNMINH